MQPGATLVESQTEEWREVLGAAHRYEVSSLGRVRSYAKGAPRILRGTVAVNGYRMFSIVPHGPTYAHHLVCTAFFGERPLNAVTRHLNGDRLDNRVANLRWGSPLENSLDTVSHGHNVQAKRLTCPRGHSLEEPNIVARDALIGRRDCLACARARALVFQAQRKGRPVPKFEALADRKFAAIMGLEPPCEQHRGPARRSKVPSGER